MTFKAWRSKKGELEDKEALEKARNELKKMEKKRFLFGGGKDHHGFMGEGVTDKDLNDKKSDIKRKEADEMMYARGYIEHR